jgi:hypothetical protein
MDDSIVEAGDEIDLIAISQGEVSYYDLGSGAFEERVSLLQAFEYPEDSFQVSLWKDAICTDAADLGASGTTGIPIRLETALSSGLEQRERIMTDMMSTGVELRTTAACFQGSSGFASRPQGTYQFYNVMWIERVGDVAYRCAVGRIRKES